MTKKLVIFFLIAAGLLSGCNTKKETNAEKLSRLYDSYVCHPGAQRSTDTGAIVVKDKTYSHATLTQITDHHYPVQNWCKH